MIHPIHKLHPYPDPDDELRLAARRILNRLSDVLFAFERRRIRVKKLVVCHRDLTILRDYYRISVSLDGRPITAYGIEVIAR